MVGLEALSEREYLGRFIILGRDKDNEHNVIVYGLTGRSPASRSRKLVYDKSNRQVLVQPLDEEEVKKGNPNLLIYPAITMKREIAVSNGAQTRTITNQLESPSPPIDVLMRSHMGWKYEDDQPHFTPRISGCVIYKDAGLCIVKRAGENPMRQFFEVPMIPGMGKLISTYAGLNVNPLPSFKGEPLDVAFESESAESCAREVYDTLAPAGRADFRIGVAVVYASLKTGNRNVAIMNRCDLREDL